MRIKQGGPEDISAINKYFRYNRIFENTQGLVRTICFLGNLAGRLLRPSVRPNVVPIPFIAEGNGGHPCAHTSDTQKITHQLPTSTDISINKRNIYKLFLITIKFKT